MSDGEINVDSIDGEVSTSANIVGQLYPQGEKGDKGDPGNDGFSPIITTEKVGKTTTITITDAEGTQTATILDGADGQGSGDMLTSVYDTDHNGIVDNSEKVNNHTVNSDVPADAVFTDTTYTAGTGIDITGNVITNTQTSAEWGNITGTLADQTDLKNALDDKANASSLATVATSGDYSDLLNKPSIPTTTSDLTNNSGFIDKDVNNLTNYDTSTTVDTKISNSEEVLIGSDSGIKASHELWVDTNDVTPYINSEISNEYGTAQNLAYSQAYQNDHNVVVSPTEPTTGEKVWVQHSDNLYGGQITDLEVGASGSFTLTLKPSTNYTMSSNIINDGGSALLFIITGTSSTGASTANNGVWNGKSRTMPTDANGKITIAYRKLNAGEGDLTKYDYKIEEGSSVVKDQTYILDDNNYNKYSPTPIDNGRILWNNSSPNSNMADGTTIYLNSDEYDVLEIYYKYTTSANMMWCKKIIKGYSAYLDIATPYYTTANYVANEFRNFTRVSDTQYTVSKCYVIHTDNTQLYREDMLIPLYIVGYKTGLF